MADFPKHSEINLTEIAAEKFLVTFVLFGTSSCYLRYRCLRFCLVVLSNGLFMLFDFLNNYYYSFYSLSIYLLYFIHFLLYSLWKDNMQVYVYGEAD